MSALDRSPVSGQELDPEREHRALLARRTLLGLGRSARGLGALFAREARAGDARPLPHFAPRARRVIYLLQNGAPSHVDLFDHKPRLREMQGVQIPDSVVPSARS